MVKKKETKDNPVVGLDGEPVDDVPAFAGDGVNTPAEGGPYVLDIEAQQERIDKIMDEAKTKCSPHRESIKDLKLDYVEATGKTRRALSRFIAARRAARKASERVLQDRDEIQSLANELEDVAYFDSLFDYGEAQAEKAEAKEQTSKDKPEDDSV